MSCFQFPLRRIPWIIQISPRNICLGYDSSGRRIRSLPQNIVIGIVCLFLTFVLILFIGAEVESAAVRKASDTLEFFTTPHVCALLVMMEEEGDDDVMVVLNGTTATKLNETSGNGLRRIQQQRQQQQQQQQKFYKEGTNRNQTQTNNTSSRMLNNNTVKTVKSRTFSNVQEAFQTKSNNNSNSSNNNNVSEVIIAHCGDCGQCSNPNDVKIYDETKNTLTDEAKRCAARSLIWGRRTAETCLKKAVSFTDGCLDCWVENIMCDLRKCLWLCTWNFLFSRVHTESYDGKEQLNPCTECDEKRCGPAFITCAGANRRRVGIISDIERDFNNEVCQATNDSWWMDDALMDYWIQSNN